MAKDTQPSSPHGPINRLIRTFSNTKVSQIPTVPKDATTKPSAKRPTKDTSPSNSHPKLSVVGRIKLFAISKVRKGPKIPFPPPSWFEDGNVVHPGASGAAPVPIPQTPEGGDGEGGNLPGEEDGDNTPPAAWIARKVQAMIDSLPPLSISSASSDPSQSKDVPAGESPPPDPIDSKLLKFLSNASIMNGSISKGRQSVWSALETLHSPWHLTGEEVQESRDGNGEEGDDDPTLMMYAPLVPNENSKVEIARSHMGLVPISKVEGLEMKIEGEAVKVNEWPWPFNKWKGKPKEDVPPGDNKGKCPVPPKAENPPEGAPQKPGKMKEVRVWEPSATKLTVQAMWWGYRLYLPPPVMLVLNDKSLEAAKKAALITTALKWLVDHIPVALLPPQFRPIVLLLQKLVPFVGYIGAFIAWSWTAIKGFDKGYGVILTATWILPIGLIPSGWDEKDFPKPKPEPPVVAPAPAPSPGSGGAPPPGDGKTPQDGGKTPSGGPPVIVPPGDGKTPTVTVPPTTPPSDPTTPPTTLPVPDDGKSPVGISSKLKSKEKIKAKKGK